MESKTRRRTGLDSYRTKQNNRLNDAQIALHGIRVHKAVNTPPRLSGSKHTPCSSSKLDPLGSRHTATSTHKARRAQSWVTSDILHIAALHRPSPLPLCPSCRPYLDPAVVMPIADLGSCLPEAALPPQRSSLLHCPSCIVMYSKSWLPLVPATSDTAIA
jgi:hypothetical protein